MVSANNAPLPQPTAAFFDQAGGLSQVWFNWFLAVQSRTGGNTPNPPSVDILQKQIAALFVEEAMNDVPEPSPVPGYAMDIVTGDGADKPNVSALLLALTAMDEPKQQPNPFMAALLVGDVS